MKLKIVSDLHIDCTADKGKSIIDSIPADDHDLLIIAGDLAEAQNIDLFADAWQKISSKFKKVIYVTGNHEMWSSESAPQTTSLLIDEVLEEFNNVVRIKSGEAHNIDSHRFIGDTMWYPDSGNTRLQNDFADFSMVPRFRSYVFKENDKFIEMFKNGFAQKNDVVISHHMPSYKLVSKKYKNDPFNQFFVTEMESAIYAIKPKLWLYGHTHDQNDAVIDSTRCVNNAHGYPRESTVRGFNENLVIEI